MNRRDRDWRPSFVGECLAQEALRDLELAHDQLAWIEGPEASYARRLLARLGARIRGTDKKPAPPPPPVLEAVEAPWEGVDQFAPTASPRAAFRTASVR